MIPRIALLLAATCLPSTPASPPVDLNTGLVAYYPLDGNADDASGNLHHGTVHGATPAPDRFGAPGAAYSFDGVDDYIVAAATGLPTGERTVAFWFYAESADQPVMLSYGGGSCGTSWLMAMNGITPSFYSGAYYLTSHCDANTTLHSYTAAPTGRWIHWAASTEQGHTRLYLDGMEVEDASMFINNTEVDGKDLSLGVATSPGGIAPYTDINVQYLHGMLDEVRIYERSLSALEVLQLSGQTITCGQTVQGEIKAPGEVAAYEIYLQAPGVIAPTIADVTEIDPGFEACMELYSPSGQLLGSGCYGLDNGVCPVPGTYILLVFDDGADQRGTYTLNLQAVSQDLTCGTSLSCGSTTTGMLDSGQVDAYSFYLPMPGAVAPTIADLLDLDPGFEACMELYSPSGQLLGSGCYGLDNGACPVPGTYTLLVFDDGVDQRGTYSLNFQSVSSSLSCGAPIQCGGSSNEVLGMFGQVASYVLDVSRPTVVGFSILDIVEMDPGFEALLEVYDSVGAFLGGTGDSMMRVLQPGRYTLLVFDDQVDQRGSYRLQVRCRATSRRL